MFKQWILDSMTTAIVVTVFIIGMYAYGINPVSAYTQLFNTWSGTCANFCTSNGYGSSQTYGYNGGFLTGCSACTLDLGAGATGGPWGGNQADCSLISGLVPKCITQCACTAAVAPLSDLTADPANPTSAIAGTTISFSALVKNIGAFSTNVSFSNFFQVATATGGGGVITDLPAQAMSVLAAGANATSSQTYTFPSSGTYSIRVCADKVDRNDMGVITEADENNNCGAWTDVTVSAGTPPTGLITPQNCIITSGTTCSASIAWTTSSASNPEIKVNGSTFSFAASSVGTLATLNYGLNTLTLYDGTTSLDTRYASGFAADQGVAGSSCGGTFATAPTTGLCSGGTPSSVTTTGTGWTWTCGSGVGLIACTATKATPLCGNNTCESGESLLSCPKDCKFKFWQF